MSFPAQILLGVVFIALGIGLANRAQESSWLRWVALVLLAPAAALDQGQIFQLSPDHSTVIRSSGLVGKACE
jgi:hypothetical protein